MPRRKLFSDPGTSTSFSEHADHLIHQSDNQEEQKGTHQCGIAQSRWNRSNTGDSAACFYIAGLITARSVNTCLGVISFSSHSLRYVGAPWPDIIDSGVFGCGKLSTFLCILIISDHKLLLPTQGSHQILLFHSNLKGDFTAVDDDASLVGRLLSDVAIFLQSLVTQMRSRQSGILN